MAAVRHRRQHEPSRRHLGGAACPRAGQQQAPGAPPAQAAAPDNGVSREAQGTPPKAVQKPDGTQRPSRKSQAENQSGAKKQSGTANGATGTVVQNGATTNAARIDLANPTPAGTSGPALGAVSPDAESAPKKQPGLWESLNPFGTD